MKWFCFVLLFPVCWSTGCHQATSPVDMNIRLDTTLFSSPQPVGVITDPALAEVSGMAPSVSHPGLLWTEEDSDNPNQIQLIHPAGAVAGRFTLPTLTNHDWEDVAAGPGPVAGKSYVYLAEIGDNAAGPISRALHRVLSWTASKVIYRFVEPDLADRKLPVTATITTVDALTLLLPNGPEDAEAMLLDPVINEFFLLSKGRVCNVYRTVLPRSPAAPVAMQYVCTLPFKRVTSAALSPDGREILIRTYKQLFYYQRRTGESVLTALRGVPRQLPLAAEPQGEAIGWSRDGTGFYSTSEVLNHEPQVIYFYRRLGNTTAWPEPAGKQPGLQAD